MSTKRVTSIKKPFNDAYMLLRGTEKNEFRERVKKSCNWCNDGDFGLKKNGQRNIKLEHWEIVKNIFHEYGIDADSQTLLEA